MNYKYFLKMMKRARCIDVLPEVEEVELQGGVKAKIPKADAEAYRAARQKDKGERETLAQRVATIDAEKRQATEAAETAKRDADAQKALARGDMDKLKETLTVETKAQIDKMSKATIRSELSAVATRLLPGLDSLAYQDIVRDNVARCRVNPESLQIEVLDEAGQPLRDSTGKTMGVDTLIETYVKERPWFKPTKTPRGDGNVSRADTPALPDTMTIAHQQALMKAGKTAWTPAHAKALREGKLKIVD